MEEAPDKLQRRAVLSTALGITSMVLATGGCCSCGGGWLLAAITGAVAFMMARSSLATRPDSMGSTNAYARMGSRSGLIGAIFSAGCLLLSVTNLVGWWLGIWGLINL
ncbi:MAG: hypothetical protein ACI9MC_000768 [Kiritimatiellia bacterium]|jgi:hypothetical protein